MSKPFAEIEKSFLQELNALLDKYSASLDARDHYNGYAECGEDVRMTVEIPYLYDENNVLIQEGGDIDLGNWMSYKKKKRNAA